MKTNRLYIGNLSHLVTVHKLQELFSKYGQVKRASIVEGRNYGFVQMSNRASAKKAKTALDGLEFEGSTLRVERAHPRRKRKPTYRRQLSRADVSPGRSAGSAEVEKSIP